MSGFLIVTPVESKCFQSGFGMQMNELEKIYQNQVSPKRNCKMELIAKSKCVKYAHFGKVVECKIEVPFGDGSGDSITFHTSLAVRALEENRQKFLYVCRTTSVCVKCEGGLESNGECAKACGCGTKTRNKYLGIVWDHRQLAVVCPDLHTCVFPSSILNSPAIAAKLSMSKQGWGAEAVRTQMTYIKERLAPNGFFWPQRPSGPVAVKSPPFYSGAGAALGSGAVAWPVAGMGGGSGVGLGGAASTLDTDPFHTTQAALAAACVAGEAGGALKPKRPATLDLTTNFYPANVNFAKIQSLLGKTPLQVLQEAVREGGDGGKPPSPIPKGHGGAGEGWAGKVPSLIHKGRGGAGEGGVMKVSSLIPKDHAALVEVGAGKAASAVSKEGSAASAEGGTKEAASPITKEGHGASVGSGAAETGSKDGLTDAELGEPPLPKRRTAAQPKKLMVISGLEVEDDES